MSVEKCLERAVKVIRKSKALIITAGAGLGVDSGLPDFRGPEGFWKAYPPYKNKGLELQDTSNPQWFEKDPHFVWGFYGHRYHLYKNTSPHKGFQILKEWAENKEKGYFVFTSNVDGHFQRAGFDDTKIVECHGSINYLQKLNGCYGDIDEIWPVSEDFQIEFDKETFRAMPPLPCVPGTNELARPNILMFGDTYWNSSRTSEQEERFRKWFQKVRNEQITVIEIGAGCHVPTVRNFTEHIVRCSNPAESCYIRINPQESNVSGKNNISLPLKGLFTLECLDNLLNKS